MTTNALPKETHDHVTPSNPQGLYIHEAYGYYYVANKWGGFSRHNNPDRARLRLAKMIGAN